jgi:hypothetical protein
LPNARLACDGPHDWDAEEGYRLVVCGPDGAQRPAIEAFIRGIYAKRFGASPTRFAPTLVGLTHEQHGLVAVAGHRRAAHSALFLERYLDAPVEQLLNPQSPPQREKIVEVGHLAASRPGEGLRLIMLMGPYLQTQGLDWVVSTLTSELRHLFLRIGVTPMALGRADASALGGEAGEWGSYYEHHPVVVAGYLPQALQQLARRQGDTQ